MNDALVFLVSLIIILSDNKPYWFHNKLLVYKIIGNDIEMYANYILFLLDHG